LDPAFLGPIIGSPANIVHPDLALIIVISICAAEARVQRAPKKLLVFCGWLVFPLRGAAGFLVCSLDLVFHFGGNCCKVK
jgi:hypothetical protein